MRKNPNMLCIRVVGCVLGLLPIGGCTMRGEYEGFRQGARNECHLKPSQTERAECLARTQKNFDEYSRERDTAQQGHSEKE